MQDFIKTTLLRKNLEGESFLLLFNTILYAFLSILVDPIDGQYLRRDLRYLKQYLKNIYYNILIFDEQKLSYHEVHFFLQFQGTKRPNLFLVFLLDFWEGKCVFYLVTVVVIMQSDSKSHTMPIFFLAAKNLYI